MAGLDVVGSTEGAGSTEGDPPADGATGVLAGLAPGARARVVRVIATGAGETARRLEDLGFTPGSVVEVIRRAPLRDPLVYRVKDYEICLRRAQAETIQVMVIG